MASRLKLRRAAPLVFAVLAGVPARAEAGFPPIPKAAATPTEVLIGEPVQFSSAGTVDPDMGPQPISYLWDFGDGVQSSDPNPVHAFDGLGLQLVTLTVNDGEDQAIAGLEVVVLEPPTPTPPTRSAAIVLRSDDTELWLVNPDSNSITRVELGDGGGALTVTELEVCDDPRTLAWAAGEAELLVACHAGDELVVVDAATATVLDAVALGRAPFGVAVIPDAGPRPGHVLVSHEGEGSVWLLDPQLELQTRLELGPNLRAIAIESDGTRAYVGQFLTRGEVGVITAIDLGLGALLPDDIQLVEDQSIDASSSGGGYPNLLGGLAIDPTGRELWIGGHKANTGRGLYQNGEPLAPRNRIRGLLAHVTLGDLGEDPLARIDTNDADTIAAIGFSPLGRYAYVTHRGAGSLTVYDLPTAEIVDTGDGATVPFADRIEIGDLPADLAISSDGTRAYVSAELSRELAIVDLSDPAAPAVVDRVSVTAEPLAEAVALGKRMFNRSREPIHSDQNYIACAGCHPDGGHDGRTWDFSQFGEGLRNTIDLRGHGGMAHGPVHWSANFDEIQDFENDIVDGFGGEGLAQDGLPPHPPLGPTPNAGRSAELDALATYVSSLAATPRSPHRELDGSLPPAAARGRELFYADALGCADCHAPPRFTDSTLTADPAAFVLHDVGTLGPGSGGRLGGELVGLDTPTLLGLWAGAPYLHDGSASLLEVLTTRNPDDLHGQTSQLSDGELADLVAFLLALDGSADELPDDVGGETGDETAGETAATESGDASSTGETGPGAADSGAGCSCEVGRPGDSSTSRGPAWLVLLFGLGLGLRARGTFTTLESLP